jgi:hypothetical protein
VSKPGEMVFKMARLAGVNDEPFEYPVAAEHAQVVSPQKW